MKSKHVSIGLIFLLVYGLNQIQAQEAISTAGRNTSGSGGTVTSSIGQVVYSTFAGTNGSIGFGIQQAYEISQINGMDEVKGIDLNCSVFPNPTSNFLFLKIEDINPANLSFQLYDASGKQLKDEKLTANQTQIDLTDIARSAYFLRITENNKIITSFKIIKN